MTPDDADKLKLDIQRMFQAVPQIQPQQPVEDEVEDPDFDDEPLDDDYPEDDDGDEGDTDVEEERLGQGNVIRQRLSEVPANVTTRLYLCICGIYGDPQVVGETEYLDFILEEPQNLKLYCLYLDNDTNEWRIKRLATWTDGEFE